MPFPPLDLGHQESPTPLNPLASKASASSASFRCPPAIASAIEDALSEFGVRITHFPILPSDIVGMVAKAKRA